jgi:hypothetical protein
MAVVKFLLEGTMVPLASSAKVRTIRTRFSQREGRHTTTGGFAFPPLLCMVRWVHASHPTDRLRSLRCADTLQNAEGVE